MLHANTTLLHKYEFLAKNESILRMQHLGS